MEDTELPDLNASELKKLESKYLPSIRSFVANAVENNRTLVFITSGGSSVPLEKNTVRSLENFSTGKRGAASAEYFLNLGYCVIYLYRENSCVPFARHFQEHISNGIDFDFLKHLSPLSLTGLNEKENEISPNLKLVLDDFENTNLTLSDAQYKSKLLKWAFVNFTESLKKKIFLSIPYVTVTSYLHFLRAISIELRPLESKAMIYLGAAISDFYIPDNEIPEHKIQSSSKIRNQDFTLLDNNTKFIDKSIEKVDEGLTIKLKNVPKCIGLLRNKWCPKAFVVSFKLETDEKILILKAKTAIKNYNVHAVVANILTTRYREIFLVIPKFRPSDLQDNFKENNQLSNISTEKVAICDYPHATELEEIFTEKLCKQHFQYMHDNSARSSEGKKMFNLSTKPHRKTYNNGLISKSKAKLYDTYSWITGKIKSIDTVSVLYFLGYTAVFILSPMTQRAILSKLGFKGRQ